MKRLLLFLLLAAHPSRSEEWEMPNFSLQAHGGGCYSTGFFPGTTAKPQAGLWLGVSLSNDIDGLWGFDWFSLPGEYVTLLLPSPSQPVSIGIVMPTDSISTTVNLRWTLGDKWDKLHRRFNTVPYLFGGLGLDFVVDEPPAIVNGQPAVAPFLFNKSFDILYGMNLGAGMDFPLGDGGKWLLYAEGLDHLVFWQGLAQVFTVRAGLKVMVDSAHLDPFK